MARTFFLDAQWDLTLDGGGSRITPTNALWDATADYAVGAKVAASNGFEYVAQASSGPSASNRYPATNPVREDCRVWRVLSGSGIATVAGPYAIAQNVANAVRLFTNDAYFDADRGIPHFDIELGHKPPYSILRTRILQAARAVEGVADATVTFDRDKRVLGGEILLTLTTGDTVSVAF